MAWLYILMEGHFGDKMLARVFSMLLKSRFFDQEFGIKF